MGLLQHQPLVEAVPEPGRASVLDKVRVLALESGAARAQAEELAWASVRRMAEAPVSVWGYSEALVRDVRAPQDKVLEPALVCRLGSKLAAHGQLEMAREQPCGIPDNEKPGKHFSANRVYSTALQ